MKKAEYNAITGTLHLAGHVPPKNTVRYRDWAITVRAMGHSLERVIKNFDREKFLRDCGIDNT